MIFKHFLFQNIIFSLRKTGIVHKLRIFQYCLVIAIVALSCSASLAKTDLKTEYRKKIHRLQKGIIEKEDQIAQSQETERTILSELEDLDIKLNDQAEKLRKLEQNMVRQHKQIDSEEQALKKVNYEKSLVQDHLQNRISSYYTMGNIGFFNVTFSTQTLPELLSFHDAYKTLIRYDKKVVETYKQTIEQIEKIKEALDLEKTILEEFVLQTQKEKILLEETRIQKTNLLTRVRTQETLHQQAIAEMQRASQRLTDSIVAIKNKNEIVENGFMANKGSLPPPVDGVLITLFDEEKTNKLGISKRSSGIELQAKDGSEIKAVSDGDVVFSGYLRGYGNTIIIYHGYKYYTVTSRVEKILVEKGQTVKREQAIGIIGETATLFDEGLYFEIRQGKISLDPLLWLDPNRLNTPHDFIDKRKNGSADSIQAKK